MDFDSIYSKFNEDIVGGQAITYHRTPLYMDGKGGKFKQYILPRDMDAFLLNNPIVGAWSEDIVNTTKKNQSLMAARSVSINKYVKGDVFDDGKERPYKDPDTTIDLEAEGKTVDKGDITYRVDSGFDTFKNINWGFRAGSGDMYGRGFYSCFKFDIVNQSSGGNKGYGGLLMKFQVSNLSNYLFVDFDEFKKTPRYREHSTRYDENNYIFQQLLDAGVPINRISALEERCGFNVSNKNIIELYGRDRFAVDFAPYFEGFVYTGGTNDGDVLVTFDLEWIAKNYLKNADPDFDSEGKKGSNRVNIFNKLGDQMAEEPNEKAKIENLIRNYDNLKSIYPLAFSIDDGKTWHQIPVSDTIKQKIFALRNAYSANNLKMSPSAKISADEILKAYTNNGRFNIPFSYIKNNALTIDDVNNYLKASPDTKLVFMTGQNASYYAEFDKILDSVSNGLNQFYLKCAGSEYCIDANDNDLDAKAEIETTNRLIGQGATFNLDESVDTFYSKSMDVELERLRHITSSRKDLVLDARRGGCAIWSPKDPPFTVDFISEVNMYGLMGDQDLDAINAVCKGVKIIRYYYDESRGEYSNIIDLVKAKTTIRYQPNSFDAFKKSSILKRLKYINLNIKDKDGHAPNLNKLFTANSVSSLVDYLSDGGHKVIIEDAVLSCTKDKALGRDVSAFIADNNVLINNLSLIGDFECIGNKRTFINNCCLDYAAFNAIKDHIAVLKTMHIYMPDVTGKKIKITNEFLDTLRKICKFPYPYIYFKGDVINSQYDLSELTPENGKFFRKIASKAPNCDFYKYINMNKPANLVSAKTNNTEDDVEEQSA